MLFSNSEFPVDNETREWLDARISWIVVQFGMRQIRSRSTVTIQQELFDGYSPEDAASLRVVLDRLCADLEIRSELVEYTIREEELISRDNGTALRTYLVVQVVAPSNPELRRKISECVRAKLQGNRDKYLVWGRCWYDICRFGAVR